MARVLRFRNFGVYVLDERGSPHHLPHAHIRLRGQHVASVFLITLELFNVAGDVDGDLVAELEDHQDELLAAWEELNGD
jgi:hypothetical protein